MSKGKKWITAAMIMVGTGLIICIVSLAVLGFDFNKFSTVVYISKTCSIEENFENISIDADIEDIIFLPSDDKCCRISLYEEEKNPHYVMVEGDTLRVGRNNDKLQVNFGMVMDNPEIVIYLPKTAYGKISIEGDTEDVELPETIQFESIRVISDTGNVNCKSSASGKIFIKTGTGDINVSGVSASEIEAESDSGRMDISDVKAADDVSVKEGVGDALLKNISCRNLISKGDTGILEMTGVFASGEFRLERTTGDIEFDSCDAGSVYVKTDTGSVTGNLLTDKIFIPQTDTGNVDVPKTITGGRCEITTGTGDIRIRTER